MTVVLKESHSVVSFPISKLFLDIHWTIYRIFNYYGLKILRCVAFSEEVVQIREKHSLVEKRLEISQCLKLKYTLLDGQEQ